MEILKIKLERKFLYNGNFLRKTLEKHVTTLVKHVTKID